ncbi:MAG: hypothetical protein ACRC7G_16895 [Beijerinckiaceae bacterium]
MTIGRQWALEQDAADALEQLAIRAQYLAHDLVQFDGGRRYASGGTDAPAADTLMPSIAETLQNWAALAIRHADERRALASGRQRPRGAVEICQTEVW